MNDRKVFADSVTPLPAQGLTPHGLMVSAAQPVNRDEKMTLLFSVAIPEHSQADLEARVERGEVVPIDELNKKYSADAASVKSLVSWLKEQGYKITHQTPDNTGVYAEASVDKIAKSLAVNMVRVTKDGLTYTAAQDAPSMPADVAKNVHAIVGLQPFRRAHKHFRICTPKSGNRMGVPGGLAAKKPAAKKTARGKYKAGAKPRGSNMVPSPNIQNAPPYLVSEILKAYNADGLTFTGKGQTIAILIDTVPADADLQTFWKRNGAKTTLKQIEKINVNNVPLPTQEGEETLDVEWTSGIAPNATIRIYATGSLQFVNLDRALDRILADLPGQPQMRQLSISLGLGETFMGGPQGEVAAQHQKLLRLAAAGVNVFVSSGDAGSNPDDTGHSPTGPQQAEYESSDPCVIAVGGTTLTLSTKGEVANEIGWSSSGGGKSIFFKRPDWQKGLGMPADNARLVPDVSAAADPDTGALLVLHGKVTQIGGTSWSAPIWAGICALINEARAATGKPFLPFLNPLIYPLMGTACFRDVTAGSNGAFKASAGYDMVTGIGVPNVKELIKKLTQ
ncbi:MAG TPA: S53 family peptidase [Gemmataceae bacterium]